MSGNNQPWKSQIATVAGVFRVSFSESGLAKLDFPDAPPPNLLPALATQSDETRINASLLKTLSAEIIEWRALTQGALDAFFRGGKPDALPPFDLQNGTQFQREIWRAMVRIPRGETRSYGEIAAAVGRPKAARAVGQACGTNPIPVLIPCHRVLASGGKLGGFGGGLAWKRFLLEIEGIHISPLLKSLES